MKIKYISKTLLFLFAFSSACFATDGDRNDPSFAKRAKELVSKMTLEEKVSQMIEASPAIQRLNIPAYNWWNEILHGVARSKHAVTVFPQAIAMAANFDRDAIRMMGEIASDEARAIYNKEVSEGKFGQQYRGLTFWTPNINIFRDPRWGRGQETYGEDPYLTSELACAIVAGLEGNHPKYLKVSACAKHFAVHSGPEESRHVFNAKVDKYDLWNTYLPAFEKLVIDAQVSSVMCAYNRFEDKPCCGSSELMIDILRKRWKFNGYVTSDCGAINDFWEQHKTSPDSKTAAAESVKSGTDLECGTEWTKLWTYNSLEQAVNDGLLDEKTLDKSLCRLLEIKFRLGMFDDPTQVPYSKIGMEVLNAPKHKEHALKMAQQSMVLLKNNGILPLKREKVKTIAVIGPNANNDVTLLGNYNGIPEEAITPLIGIKRKLGEDVNIIFHKATNHILPLDSVNHNQIFEELSMCDVIVFVGGISASLEGEQGCVDQVLGEGFVGGDRTTIMLPKVQTEYMKQLKKLNKPIIFVNMSGSAMGLTWEDKNVDAIVQAWYAGQSTGDAIADVLFGDYNPSGRLPITFYEKDSDLPDFEDYSMFNRTYRYFVGRPLYEFGYGLSYTKFVYQDIKMTKTKKGYKIDVNVKNVGAFDGDEIVQVYITPEFSDLRLPKCQLKDFCRINLKKRESKQVTFEIQSDAFSINDNNGYKMQIKGDYSICVGGRQPSTEALNRKEAINCQVKL